MTILASKTPRRAHEFAPARHRDLVGVDDGDVARPVVFRHLAIEPHIVAAQRARLSGADALALDEEARPALVHLRLHRRAVDIDDTHDELHFLSLELRRILRKLRTLDELGMVRRLAVDGAPSAAASREREQEEQRKEEGEAPPAPFP